MLARLNVENLPSLLVLEQVSTVGQTPGLGSGHSKNKKSYTTVWRERMHDKVLTLFTNYND